MKIIRSVRDAQRYADARRAAGRRIALVPTMGALHRGHFALVEEALNRADEVTVSIFVNPTQFAPDEDFERYPRKLEEDAARLAELSDRIVVFAPPLDQMYPRGVAENRTWVEVEELDRHLCGRHRPGHFRGVTTVVAKLFIACKPHVAVFGMKDAQQFVIIQQMVQDLLMDVEVVGVPTVREEDGLAFSSRNVYLTPVERAQATVLSQAVREAEQRIAGGEQRSEAIVEAMRSRLARAPDARVQYVEVVDARKLQPIDIIRPNTDVLAAAAVFFGGTRLIDNAFVRSPDDPDERA